ncbi:MAG: DUF6883 domain-containing protein [Pseudolabrys sp.]
MPRLPNADRAVIDLRKLADYCLDPKHPRGRHKARVFLATLGIDRTDARWLQEEIAEALPGGEAVALASDRYGTHWRVDIPVTRQGMHNVIRTLWIVKAEEDFPRFITCWVL